MTAGNKKLLAGALLGSISILVGLYFFASNNMVYYWRTDELVDRSQERGIEALSQNMIRLGALVKADTKTWEPEKQTLRFVATNAAVDAEGEEQEVRLEEIPVFSQGAPPAMFREGIAVVVEGYYAQPDCTAIAAEVAAAKACIGDYAVGAFRAQADRCGLSLDASRFAEACEQEAFAKGPAFVSDELLVKHSNEYRLADEDVEDVSELYAPVEGL